jgi:methylated-DNA-[protein]-cysteine S-methyltransferase
MQDSDGDIMNPDPPLLSVLKDCVDQLDNYFAGTLTSFTFPILQNGTEFQQNVWKELVRIPFGKTISYLELSKRLGNTKVIRAAASANGKNSLAIVVPCHRVIGTSGTLVGYAGGLWRKKWLLDHEAKYAHGVQAMF